MNEFRRATAADVSGADAAAALHHVFRQYVVPISFTEPAYAIHIDANDVDLASSPIWYDGDGNVAAAAVLGVRGERAWIGGFGIAAELRGRGLGRELLCSMVERSRTLGHVTIALEVLAVNAAARRTYEAGGFFTSRRLATFETDADAFRNVRADAPYAGASAFLDLVDADRPCWQRESASLRKQTNLHAVGNRNAFCIFRHNGERAQLMGVRADSHERFAVLCASIVAQTGVTRLALFNEAYESAAADAARALGWTTVHEQAEMQLIC